MAYPDTTDKLERRESWNTDNTSSVDLNDSKEWLIDNSKPRAIYNPLRIRIGRRRSLLRLARSRPLYRLGCLLLALAAIQAYLLHQDYLNALIAKSSPTMFTLKTTHDEHLLANPRWQLNAGAQDGSRRAILSNQASWKKLGSGYEGNTFVYNGTVIKVFKTDRGPLRNCVPGTLSPLAWPSEIPASLLLGGLADTMMPATSDDALFAPILDYFLLPTESKDTGKWHLITPYLSSGTLDHLAKRLRNHDPALTANEVDAHFRPSLHRILEALNIMHSQHNLCHDDVKLNNIFVTDYITTPAERPGNTNYSVAGEMDTHWVLGDLGNAREPSHSYHTSLLWSHDNYQHPDCRVNDLRRLIKSYVLFLQASMKHSDAYRDAFMRSFLSGSASWSRLYWYIMHKEYETLEAAAARHIHDLSATVFSPVDAKGDMVVERGLEGISNSDEIQRLARPSLGMAWFDHTWLDIDEQSRRVWTVGRELGRGLGLSERWAKFFGTMGIMKTPARRC